MTTKKNNKDMIDKATANNQSQTGQAKTGNTGVNKEDTNLNTINKVSNTGTNKATKTTATSKDTGDNIKNTNTALDSKLAQPTNVNQPKSNTIDSKKSINSDVEKTPIDKPKMSNKASPKGGEHKVISNKGGQDLPPKPEKKQQNKKSSGNGLAFLALLVGLVGTGFGAYSISQLRSLNPAEPTDLADNISALIEQSQHYATQTDLDVLKGQIENIGDLSLIDQNMTALSDRISGIEQTQKGILPHIEQQLSDKTNEISPSLEALESEIQELKLSQNGLASKLESIAQVGVSSTESVTSSDINRLVEQEASFLVRLADYTLKSTGDTKKTASLLLLASNHLKGLNDTRYTDAITLLTEGSLRLQGVQAINYSAINDGLKSLNEQVAALSVKTSSDTNQAAEEDNNDQTEASNDSGVLDKVISQVKGAVVYTPNDPNAIDISMETALIEKRFIQLDLKSAEIAVQTKDQTLFLDSLMSAQDRIKNTFADDEVSKSMLDVISSLSTNKLMPVLPDLKSLTNEFDGLVQ